jgi:hypothetical protein
MSGCISDLNDQERIQIWSLLNKVIKFRFLKIDYFFDEVIPCYCLEEILLQGDIVRPNNAAEQVDIWFYWRVAYR